MKPVLTPAYVLVVAICAGVFTFAAQSNAQAGGKERPIPEAVSVKTSDTLNSPVSGPTPVSDGTPPVGIQPSPTPVSDGTPPVGIQPSPTPISDGTPPGDGRSDWTGTTDSDFNTGSNWTAVTGSAPPVPGDVAYFTSSPTNKNVNLSSSSSIAGLYFNGTSASGYTISASPSQTLTLTGYATSIGTEIGDSSAVAIGAENTSGTNTISAPIILAPSSGTTSTIFQAAGGTLALSGVISGTGVALDKTGDGILILSGANTYTGATIINGGTLTVDNAGSTTPRLAGTTSITVNASGTLLLASSSGSSNDRINDAATMTLNGGTFNTAGLSEHGATNNTAGIGALTLSASSIIDMGSGSSIIAFVDSHLSSWTGTLSIYNWSGTPLTGSGTDQLYFGNSSSGLNSTQLGEINFYSNDGTNFLGAAIILADGEIVPVPEPGTWFAGALAVIGLAGISYRRFRRPRDLVTS